MLWFTLLACQEPFDLDRHDLVGFRVAAIALQPSPDDTLTLSAAVVDQGRAWTEEPVDLAWFEVASPRDVAELDPLSPAVALGPSPVVDVPDEPTVLGLVARLGDQQRRAFVEIAPVPPEAVRVEGIDAATLSLTVPGAPAEDLLLEARRQLTPGEQTDRTAPGGTLRLTARLTEGDPGIVRWMATGGTFFELSPTVADWIASDVLLDSDEFERDPVAMAPSTVTVLGLVLGDGGGTHFLATELHVGDAEDGVWVNGRWMPTDGPVAMSPGEALRGVLEADDASPVGVRLTAAVAEDASTIPDGGWGTSGLDCLVPVSGPFDPSWLLTQWCSRSALIGATVALLPTDVR
ncbi:MAG: hypothetical protein KTR31_13595 [Myxococcales bacterium]|nr:hypothetical protein [Myxococcales bacterium]